MSFYSDLTLSLNNMDTTGSASDLFVAAKSAIDSGMINTPMTFVTKIYDRMNSDTTVDFYELAFLIKTITILNAWSLFN